MSLEISIISNNSNKNNIRNNNNYNNNYKLCQEYKMLNQQDTKTKKINK